MDEAKDKYMEIFIKGYPGAQGSPLCEGWRRVDIVVVTSSAADNLSPEDTGRYNHLSLVLASFLLKVAVMLRNYPNARRLLKKIGFEKDDIYFWKQMGKAMLCTYTLFGLAWLWNETSPLGWWTLKPRPKEEREMAHLYERRKFPYPGDQEAVEEFIKSGGTLGTTIGPKGFVEVNVDSNNMQKHLQSKKFEQEAQKLWFRMRNEVIQELQEKGFDIE